MEITQLAVELMPDDIIMVPKFEQAKWSVDLRQAGRTDFAMAVMTAPAKTVFLYFRGDLMSARQRGDLFERKRWLDSHPQPDEAWDLYEKGWVELVQRKVNRIDGEYEYLAIKRGDRT